ncbi:MAG: hypothetical protein QXJ25_03500 [Candidatus Aenigmatarchaeota archaeon]
MIDKKIIERIKKGEITLHNVYLELESTNLERKLDSIFKNGLYSMYLRKKATESRDFDTATVALGNSYNLAFVSVYDMFGYGTDINDFQCRKKYLEKVRPLCNEGDKFLPTIRLNINDPYSEKVVNKIKKLVKECFPPTANRNFDQIPKIYLNRDDGIIKPKKIDDEEIISRIDSNSRGDCITFLIDMRNLREKCYPTGCLYLESSIEDKIPPEHFCGIIFKNKQLKKLLEKSNIPLYYVK